MDKQKSASVAVKLHKSKYSKNIFWERVSGNCSRFRYRMKKRVDINPPLWNGFKGLGLRAGLGLGLRAGLGLE